MYIIRTSHVLRLRSEFYLILVLPDLCNIALTTLWKLLREVLDGQVVGEGTHAHHLHPVAGSDGQALLTERKTYP